MAPGPGATVARLVAVLVAVHVALLGLAGCSADDEPAASPSTTPSATPESPNEAYGLPLPAGVELTAQGSDLRVGDQAKVAWQLPKDRVGVLALRVDRIRRGRIEDFRGFVLDGEERRATPYYVDATARNLGTTDLSGVPVPLYLQDGKGVLVSQSTFQAAFPPCAARPQPKGFVPGRRAAVCLVFVVQPPGELESVTFRPVEDYEAIEWRGRVVPPRAARQR